MSSEDDESKFERFKQHLRENKKVYLAAGGGVLVGGTLFAGISWVIMRGHASPPIGSSFSGAAGSRLSGAGENVASQSVVGDNNVLSMVSYISANRQGPPSWVVRCVESNKIYESQHTASIAENVNEAYLSQHLNGLLKHANNKHFERICMAA